MGRIHPDRSTIQKLRGAERSFAEVLIDRLSDDWLIISQLDMISPRRPYEIDFLLMNPQFGIMSIEVKGGEVDVKDGEWYRREHHGGVHHFRVPPPRQAQDAAYELRNTLRDNDPSFRHLKVAHAVALPDVSAIGADLPLGVTREMLFLSPDLQDIEAKILKCIEIEQTKHQLSGSLLQNFFQIVLPNSRMVFEPDAQRAISREILNHISHEQVRAMASLDENHRVIVQGSAGTGKTRLAILWARRAVQRNEKTLLTCYNDPLATFLNATSSDRYLPNIQPFLRFIKDLNGIPELVAPSNPDELDKYWNLVLPQHVLTNIHLVSEKFETIVVDEFQDFAPNWISILENLLGDNGKLLCVADTTQDLYQRGFEAPTSDKRWTKGRLAINCRNTREIASLLQKLGGALPAASCPTGEKVKFIAANTKVDVLGATEKLIDQHVNFNKLHASDLLIICRTQQERSELRELPTTVAKIGSWESRAENHVACETYKRVKGLEADHVAIVSFDGTFDAQELYVAASRARSTLTIIAPTETGRKFSLD